MNYYQIALDGPSGVGKSSVARQLANELAFTYINTGLMFRAIAYVFAHYPNNTDLTAFINHLQQANTLVFVDHQVYYQNELITPELKASEISQLAAKLSQIPQIRQLVLTWEHQIMNANNVIMEGRDIGTVVIPNATLKIFLTASAQVRATRRYQELQKLNLLNKQTYQDIYQKIVERDHLDKNRELAPLIPAVDAITINTDDLSIDQIVLQIKTYFLTKLKAHN